MARGKSRASSNDNQKTGPRRSARIAQRAIVCKSCDWPGLNTDGHADSPKLKEMDLNDENLSQLNTQTSELEEELNRDKDGALLWNEQSEETFILLMEEEVRNGNRSTSTFNVKWWNNLLAEMIKRTGGYPWEKHQLRNKFNIMRFDYKIFKRLMQETGVEYNQTTGMIILSDERWERLSKVFRNCKKFKKKPCKHYDKQSYIFDETIAIGSRARASTRVPSRHETEKEKEHVCPSNNLDGDDDDDEEEEEGEGGGRQRSRSPRITRRNKKESFMVNTSSALEKLSDSNLRKANAYEKKVEAYEKALLAPSSSVGSAPVGLSADSESGQGNAPKADVDMMFKCMQAMDSLDGIDHVQYSKAITNMINIPLWRNVFLKMSDDRKKGWISTL